MHELSLVEGIVSTIEAKREKTAFSRVKEIHIICGQYNCLAEDSLKFFFAEAVKGSYMQGAQLKLHRISLPYWCTECAREFEGIKEDSCPLCGGKSVIEIDLNGVYLGALDVDD